MVDIGARVAELIAAGCAPDVAARVVAETYVAGVESAAFRGISGGNSGGIPVDEVAEKRRAYDRARKRNSTGIPPESTGIPRNSESASLSKEKKEEKNKEERETVSETFHRKSNRGARLASGWEPTSPDHAAGLEMLGREGLANELAKFRDYWAAQPGQRGVKLDWDATFRNWIRNTRKPSNGRRTVHDAANDLIAKISAFDQPAPGGLRGGEGEDAIRLLPPGRRQ